MQTLILCLAALIPAAPGKKLNIISIVTDDQAVWTIGAYGNKEVKTPHMDRIAREGAQFTRAFTATPVCSPSRASFMSGRYGTQVGIHDWINPKEAQSGLGLPVDLATWPQVLQRQGYVTALIGKWHLGTLDRFHPNRRGFDHFFGLLGGGTSPMNPTFQRNNEKEQVFKGSEPEILVDDALAFIKENKAKPFAMCLHFRSPHSAYAPVPEADSAPYKDLDPTVPDYPKLDVAKTKKLTREYYGSVHSIDRNLGKLLALLDELGLAENTIVLFTSDHGYNIGHHGLWHKGNGQWILIGNNGRRPNMFATSLQVPLMIRWPGVVRPGTKVTELVSNIDTFASVLGMLGVDIPAEQKQQGMDFSKLLRGEKAEWRDAVFAQYDMHTGEKAHMRSVLTPRWHLVRQYLKNQPDELFDLESDPGETRNLYEAVGHRATRDQLQARLDAWMRSIDDPQFKR